LKLEIQEKEKTNRNLNDEIDELNFKLSQTMANIERKEEDIKK